jgi:hypothetical protein
MDRWYTKLTEPIPYTEKISFIHCIQTVGVVLAAIVCGIYWGQLEVMKRQLGEMESGSWLTAHLVVNAANQVTATRRSADIQEEQFIFNRQLIKFKEGTEVKVDYMAIDQPHQPNRINVLFTIHNAGKGLASNIRAVSKLEFLATEPPNTPGPDVGQVKNIEDTLKPNDKIWPHVEIPSETPYRLDVTRLYLWGTVWYRDKSGRNWSQFCGYLLPLGSVTTFHRCIGHQATGYEK